MICQILKTKLIFILGFYREKWIYVHKESTREVSILSYIKIVFGGVLLNT